MKKGFLTNKYTVSVIILLAILATDILLHKGMSRVILPESFTNKRMPQHNLPHCAQELQLNGKRWLKGINNPQKVNLIDSTTNGIEIDVYFDTAKKVFFAYHDSTAMSKINVEEIFAVVQQKSNKLSVWLDFKNLFEYNSQPALAQLILLREKYALKNRLLVESPNLHWLNIFCDSGFYTSYYTPFFNPYLADELQQENMIDSISGQLKKYPVSALSGYYFQTAFLKKFFPAFPILTWTDDSKVSIVNNVFNRQLEKDSSIKIVLHNIED